jgi:enhanced filamentous growth protein 1
MTPRVKSTSWEDKGTICFQVEARDICITRRGDNHIIKGTNLLKAIGVETATANSILKSEKIKQYEIILDGPLDLKGVWILFEEALHLANQEKSTELLYPLFVHNIGPLLHDGRDHNMKRTIQGHTVADKPRQLGKAMEQFQQH